MNRLRHRGLIALGGSLLASCAAQPAPPSAFEPAIGHHQPQPTTSSDDPEASPHAEPSNGASETAADTESEPSSMPTPEDEALCQHIVKLVQSESQDRATAEQTDELLVSCALALAHDRRRLGTDEFERRAACMFAATSVADFAACTPDSSDPPQ